jgi:hypothetical protein
VWYSWAVVKLYGLNGLSVLPLTPYVINLVAIPSTLRLENFGFCETFMHRILYTGCQPGLDQT